MAQCADHKQIVEVSSGAPLGPCFPIVPKKRTSIVR